MGDIRYRRLSRRCLAALAACSCLAVAGCHGVLQPASGKQSTLGSAPLAYETSPTGEIISVFDHGFADGWVDYGWAATVEPGKPASLDIGGWGGWILAKPGLKRRYANVELAVRVPEHQDPKELFRVKLGNEGDEFPAVVANLTPSPSGDAWLGTLALSEVNPDGLEFDRITLQAARDLPAKTILTVERISLAIQNPPRLVPATVEPAAVSADCSAAGSHAISPNIYGVAFSPSRENTTEGPWGLGTTARRWGGNPTSRYNWVDGHAWNTAADWFWRNVSILPDGKAAYAQFLDANRAHGVASVMTVPTLGWVAKDTTSYSFPTAVFGKQEATDPDVPGAGNGNDTSGKPLTAGPPSRTSVAASPEFVASWVRAMEASGAAPTQYILDNEPDLWNDTHRDVHPDPVTYDELARRTIDYGTAVRSAAPNAQIAGPASWGWWGYFYSAADAKAGFSDTPDRKAHGNRPLLEWLVDQTVANQQRTGVRVLDVLDVHYYPQAKGVYTPNGQGGSDAATARLRVRSTRSLWDPTYQDESWIKDRIELLPRMQRLIAEHDPALRLSIGEYSFGGEHTASGAVAQAEALGRFAQYDVDSAFYWTYPEVDSAVGAAFRAYRNYDGKGGRFLDTWVPSVSTDDVSMFTSTNGKDLVAVLVNRSDKAEKTVSATFANCGPFDRAEAFQYDGSSTDVKPLPTPAIAGDRVSLELPPWSVTTLHLSPRG